MRIFRRTRGLGLMALWAFAPAVVVQTDPTTGGLSFSVGGGRGEFSRVVRGCSGELLEEDLIPFTGFGMRAEYEENRMRATVFGGKVSQDEGVAIEDPIDGRGSGYFGGQVAYEGHTAGVGLGFAQYASWEEGLLPSLYLRIGPRERVSAVFDLLPPTTMPGVTGLVRGGISFRKTGGLGGLVGFQGTRPFDDNEGWGPVVELHHPVSDHMGLDLGGSVQFGSEGPTDWGFGLGLTVTP